MVYRMRCIWLVVFLVVFAVTACRLRSTISPATKNSPSSTASCSITMALVVIGLTCANRMRTETLSRHMATSRMRSIRHCDFEEAATSSVLTITRISFAS